MAIKLKTEAEIKILRAGGQRLAQILHQVAQAAEPGVPTRDLDQLARELIANNGDEPSFLNYQPRGAALPYPAALCVSINEEVVHGLPGERVIRDGDIVGLDLGLKHQGLFTDMAITVPVGNVSEGAKRLILMTREALEAGIKAARPGKTLGDIGAAIAAKAKRYGLGLITDLGGHGVGYKVHEAPEVANEGEKGKGLKLEVGLVIAIEPMLALGRGVVNFMPDGYTVKTADGSLSAHFEKTIAITPNGPLVLTG